MLRFALRLKHLSRISTFRSKAKINRTKNLIIHSKMASGEISYLIFIASAICIALRLRQRFGTKGGREGYYRYTTKTVNAGCM